MTTAKPLVRWTLGPVSDLGYEILLESIIRFMSLYPEFDRVLCYNNIDKNNLKKFSKYVTLFEQKEEDLPCLVKPPDRTTGAATGCGWKLCSPRLRPNSLELFLDNDLVLFSKISEIDDWMKSKRHGVISEGRWQMFGGFRNFINPKYRLCAGLFGLPPFFSFHKHIRYFYSYFNKPLGAYDEQGLTAATVSNMKNFYVVPITKLKIIENHDFFVDIKKEAVCGIHFVGANRKTKHSGWEKYKKFMSSYVL